MLNSTEHEILTSHVYQKVVVIYTTAGTHPIQNDYSHGSRFPCQNVYIHGCRASSIKVLFTRQPFLIPKSLYTWLPCIKYKSAIYTAAVSHANMFSTRLPCIKYKSAIYTAAVSHAKSFFIHGCRLSSIKALFTRQPFSLKNVQLYTLLPCLKYEMDTCI